MGVARCHETRRDTGYDSDGDEQPHGHILTGMVSSLKHESAPRNARKYAGGALNQFECSCVQRTTTASTEQIWYVSQVPLGSAEIVGAQARPTLQSALDVAPHRGVDLVSGSVSWSSA